MGSSLPECLQLASCKSSKIVANRLSHLLLLVMERAPSFSCPAFTWLGTLGQSDALIGDSEAVFAVSFCCCCILEADAQWLGATNVRSHAKGSLPLSWWK